MYLAPFIDIIRREQSPRVCSRKMRARADHTRRRPVIMLTTLGVDIGGTSVKAAVRVDGQIVRTGQSPFYAKPTTEQLLQAIHAAVGEIGELRSVGLCVPGLLDRGKRVITLAVNVPGL